MTELDATWIRTGPVSERALEKLDYRLGVYIITPMSTTSLSMGYENQLTCMVSLRASLLPSLS